MESNDLDDIDEAILYMLQGNARLSMTEMAEELPVSANTVRNRIRSMEESGTIRDYLADVDYSTTSYPFEYHFNCTVSIAERQRLAEAALDIPGVVSVTELMTGQRNLVIRAVGESQDDITRIAQALDDEGINVVSETLVKREIRRSFHHFEKDFADTS